MAIDRAFPAPAPCPTLTGDLTDDSFLSGLCQDRRVDAVIHLASLLNSASRRDPHEALRVNVGVSLKLIDLAVRAGVSRFVFGSSISAYGTRRVDDCGSVSEATPAAPTDVYGVTKRYVEIVGESRRRETGLGFVALRLPTVVGAGIRGTPSLWRGRLFERPISGSESKVEIPFLPTERVPLAHVEDVAAALCHVATAQSAPDTLYNSPAETWTCGDLADYVASLDAQVMVVCGDSRVEGIPQAIDSGRFIRTFRCPPTPIQDRLRACHGGEASPDTVDGLARPLPG
jgi:nucleoside-diphosphate-sugar epimerase